MLKVFCGEDTYSSYLAAKDYAGRLSGEKDLPMEIVDADDLSLNELLQKVQNIGLFASGRVVVAKRLLENSKTMNYVTDHLETCLGWDIVIWHDGKLDKRKGLVKKLNQQKRIQEFVQPKVWEVERWLAGQISALNVPASQAKPYATQMVVKLGDDKWQLSTELQKLELYLQIEGKLPDLDALIGTDVSGDIWKFLDGLTMGNKETAAVEFQRLTKFAQNDQYLISMLTRELSLLHDYLQVKAQGKSTKELKLHPFVLEKLSQKAQHFTLQKVKKLTQALLRLDIAIKSGKINPEVALTLYMLSW